MRRVVIALLLCGAAFCLSTFPAVSQKVGSFQTHQATSSLSLLLPGIAALCYLLAAAGMVWKVFPSSEWRVLVITAASFSLAVCIWSFAPWMTFGIALNGIVAWGILFKGWSPNESQAMLPAGESGPYFPLMYLPVPWVFILAYLLGVGLQALFPVPVSSASVLTYLHWGGGVLMLLGVSLAFWCLRLFHSARTTTVPLEASNQLVVSGPYRLSRNPMYVSLTLMFLGEAGMLAQFWPLVMLPLVLLYLNRIVIPVEEARLQKLFGTAYTGYCENVRRWM